MIGTGKGDLAELEQLAGAMLLELSPSARRALLRDVSRAVRKSQQRRIARQRNPDGSAFEPRKPASERRVGEHAKKFLYPSGGSGQPRLVYLKSWTRSGHLITGFDIERGAMRSFFVRRIVRWLPVEAGEENAGAGQIRSRPRRLAMFRKLRQARFLRAGADAREAWAGFAGRIARIARIHQEGLLDRPTPRAREIRYPERQLLGLTAEDRADLIDTILDHIRA